MKRLFPFIFIVAALSMSAQSNTSISVDASTTLGSIEPLWGDHYEMHLLFGWGSNPYFFGPHVPYFNEDGYDEAVQALEPRYIRVSSGRYDNPPDSAYFSASNAVLKDLWVEFYKGGSDMISADDLGNYDFSYVDSLVEVVYAMGAEPFFELSAMPFVLSSDTIANYNACVPACHLYSWDNSIRNSPPMDVQVYGRVMYHLIAHLHFEKGVEYFELWNEPDQFPLNTFFWKGTANELYDMYAAIVAEIEADDDLSEGIEIGCCSFAMNSFANLFPLTFLNQVLNNDTRMDFLSFHPYSGGELSGYSTSRVETATSWRDIYAPTADLVNAEWGILGADFGAEGWGDLDYGIGRAQALIDMNDRGIIMAHQASMFDTSPPASTCCIGMNAVSPSIQPKPSAYVYYNLNKLNRAEQRLQLELMGAEYAIAGVSSEQDTIVVVFPADTLVSGTVSLSVNDLPWVGGKAYRYQLTESAYTEQTPFNRTDSIFFMGNSVTDVFDFELDQESGQLILWEIIKDPSIGIEEYDDSLFRIWPNPSSGHFRIGIGEIKHRNGRVMIHDVVGRLIEEHSLLTECAELSFQIDLPGLYSVAISTDRYSVTRQIVVQ